MAATFTPKRLASGQLASATTPALLYTVPASTIGQLKALDFTNIDSVLHTVTVWLIPSGQAAPTGAGTQTPYIWRWNGANVSVGVDTGFDTTRILNAGDAIYALPSAANQINYAVFGAEEVQ